MNVVLLIAGLVLLLYGANILTDGSAALARRLHLSEFVIGLTIIAIGTSAPELVVSIMSALQGSGDVTVGNVIGSNLFNSCVILGGTALIVPLRLAGRTLWRDIPFGVLASVALAVCCGNVLTGAGSDKISRVEGFVLLTLFIVFMVYSFLAARRETPAEEESPEDVKQKPLWVEILMVIAGLAGLVYGGTLFLDGALALARSWGVSEAVISITIMAGGTSLPELVACVVAAIKKKPAMALGNVIGSNVSNIFLVVGLTSIVTPLQLSGITPGDLLALVVSSVLLFVAAFTFRRRELDRVEGAIFLLLYAGYIFWLLI